MSHEEDSEYGPTPDGAQYEHTDIDPGIAYRFAIFISIATVISVAIVYGTFWFFEGQRRASDEATQLFPLSVGRTQEPVGPRLQTQPFKDVHLVRQREHETLTTYGWVDRPNGVVRIPIDEAMRLLDQRGLPVRADAPEASETDGTVVQDSSAGRTSAAQ